MNRRKFSLGFACLLVLAGADAEVVSLKLRPSHAREILRVAVVRVAGTLLRVFVGDRSVAAGDRVRIEIQGECEVLEA